VCSIFMAGIGLMACIQCLCTSVLYSMSCCIKNIDFCRDCIEIEASVRNDKVTPAPMPVVSDLSCMSLHCDSYHQQPLSSPVQQLC